MNKDDLAAKLAKATLDDMERPMSNKDDAAGLVERLRERAKKIRDYMASSQMVVDYLAPEMEKFENREAPWDTYTVRMSADHQASIRRQNKEAAEYEEAADALTTLSARVETLEAACQQYLDAFDAGTGTVYVEPVIRQALAGDTNHG